MTIEFEDINIGKLEDQRAELASVVNKLHNRKNTSTPIRITIYETEALESILNMLHSWNYPEM